MEKRDKPTVWYIKAELPVKWRVPIRSRLMDQNRELGQWVRDAIREKAEREGIQLPAMDANTGETEPDAA